MLRWLITSPMMRPPLKAPLPSTALSPRPALAKISAWLTRSPKQFDFCFHFPPLRLLHDTSFANILGSSLWLMRGSYLLLCSFCSDYFFSTGCVSLFLLVPAGLILSCLSQKLVEESMYLHSQWDITNDNRFSNNLGIPSKFQTLGPPAKRVCHAKRRTHPLYPSKVYTNSTTSKTHQLWS